MNANQTRCYDCKRTLAPGESVWADEWKVIDVSGNTANFINETRYHCDDCSAASA